MHQNSMHNIHHTLHDTEKQFFYIWQGVDLTFHENGNAYIHVHYK